MRLVRSGQAELIGPIRQELLTGVSRDSDFERFRRALESFRDLPVGTADHEEAARCSNRCRARGIAMTGVDALVCAVALRERTRVFTLDEDFPRYARILSVRLHEVKR